MKKIKIHKESVKAILSHDLWIFLSVPIFASAAFLYLFYLLDKPKAYEQIRIFSGFEFTSEANKKISNDYKEKFKDYGILETSVIALDEKSANYGLTFGKAMFDNYDIIIGSLDSYSKYEGVYNNSSIYIDTSYITGDFDYLMYKNKPIGIKIFDKDNQEYNDKLGYNSSIYLSETTYVFASNKSDNAFRKVDDTHSINEYALKTLLNFL